MLDTHCISEFHKIGVLLMGMRIAVLVKEILPLNDHDLFLIVKNDNLNANIKLRGSGKLSECHIKRGIAVDVNH